MTTPVIAYAMPSATTAFLLPHNSTINHKLTKIQLINIEEVIDD